MLAGLDRHGLASAAEHLAWVWVKALAWVTR